MPVALEPPYSRSGGTGRGSTALTEGPVLVRGLGQTRWHRPRSGVILPRHDIPTWHLWCGQTLAAFGERFETDHLPEDGLPVCGPCEGRAVGAGQDGTVTTSPEGALRFVPESRTRFAPAKCPASRGWAFVTDASVPSEWRIARCGLCGLHVTVSSTHRGYNPGPAVLREHAPHQLPDPCPFHAWDQMTLVNGAPVCRCTADRPGEQVAP